MIETNSPPPEAMELIREGLGLRASSRQLRSGASGLQVGAPLPRYRIKARAAMWSRPKSGARLAAWDYPLFGIARPSLASLRCRERSLRFGGVVQGDLAARIVDAAAVAERAFGSARSCYRVRLLECPELKLLLLLCEPARGRTAFIPIIEGHMLLARELHLQRGLGPYLRQRAIAEHKAPPSSSDPATSRPPAADETAGHESADSRQGFEPPESTPNPASKNKVFR